MKKCFIAFIGIAMLMSLTACGGPPASPDISPDVSATISPSASPENTPSEPPADSGGQSLEDLMSSILENVPDLPAQYDTEITAENFTSYLFIDPVNGAEGLASDAMIGSIAHSVCLLRVPEGADAAAIAKSIEQNADPRKWICVEAEKTIVRQKGNLILLVMSFEADADAIAANFGEKA